MQNCLQIYPAGMLPPVKMKLAKSALLQSLLKNLLSDTHLPKTYLVVPSNSHSPAWLTTQAECPDLRRTRVHLQQGTRPSKKLTNLRDVKRYLNVATIAKDGLLVVRRDEPLAPTRECIIVPRQVLEGLLTALHIQLGHPSSHQLKAVTKRYLYALDIDKAIDCVTQACHQCAALHQTPKMREEQSSSPPPDTIGISFAADVIKHSRQLILVVRECVTSFTATTLLEDERHDTLRDALICLCVQIRPLDGPSAIIRTDPTSGFKALTEDLLLKHHRITIEIGNAKNHKKNPVAERAVQEVVNELLRHDPLGGPVSPVTMSQLPSTHAFALVAFLFERCGHNETSPQTSKYHCTTRASSSNNTNNVLPTTVTARRLRPPSPRTAQLSTSPLAT